MGYLGILKAGSFVGGAASGGSFFRKKHVFFVFLKLGTSLAALPPAGHFFEKHVKKIYWRNM